MKGQNQNGLSSQEWPSTILEMVQSRMDRFLGMAKIGNKFLEMIQSRMDTILEMAKMRNGLIYQEWLNQRWVGS